MVRPGDSAERADLGVTRELLEQGRAGDRAALDDLFARYRPHLERFLHGQLYGGARSLMETEDLVQEVCSAAYRALDRFEDRGIGSFWAFLRQVARNRVLDERRKWGRRPASTPLAESRDPAPDEDAPEPDRRVAAREELERFERALSALAERERRAVQMRVELDLPYQLIADDCGYRTESAARMAIRRALERITEQLEEPA